MLDALNQVRTAHGLLAATVKTTIHCDWLSYAHRLNQGLKGLETIVREAYGRSIELDDVDNGAQISVEVAKEKLDDYDQRLVDKAIAQGSLSQHALRGLLVDLCNRNVLPAAHYVIGVSW